jgi:hypothetical protein
VRDIRRKRVWKEQFSEDLFQGYSKSEKRQNTNVLSQRTKKVGGGWRSLGEKG